MKAESAHLHPSDSPQAAGLTLVKDRRSPWTFGVGKLA